MTRKAIEISAEPIPGYFFVRRTSLHDDEVPPCRGAKRVVRPCSRHYIEWIVQVDDVLEFVRRHKEVVISYDLDWPEWPYIEIYDDYRE